MPVAEPDKFRQYGLVYVVELVGVQVAARRPCAWAAYKQFGGLAGPDIEAVQREAGLLGETRQPGRRPACPWRTCDGPAGGAHNAQVPTFPPAGP